MLATPFVRRTLIMGLLLHFSMLAMREWVCFCTFAKPRQMFPLGYLSTKLGFSHIYENRNPLFPCIIWLRLVISHVIRVAL